MAHIEDVLSPHFTGHVGPVRFVNGRAQTDDPELLDYFRDQAGRYVITDDEGHPKRRQKPHPDPDEGNDPEE